MQDHRRLRVYSAAQRLAHEVYQLIRLLPSSERLVLASQLRRSSVSVGSNIAEGCGRSTPRDFCSYLDIALGSAREVEFQLTHAVAVELLTERAASGALVTCLTVQRMLVNLIMTIRSRASANCPERRELP